MRIVSVGGGPAGLYLAILMKQADARHEVTVLERNRPDDTFGFGVVFSDATHGHLRRRRSRRATTPSARASPTGTTSTSTIAARSSPRAATASPACRAARSSTSSPIARAPSASSCASSPRSATRDVARLARDYDLVVGADGVNSLRAARARRPRSRRTSSRGRTASSGSARPFPSAPSRSTSSRRTAGLFRVHAYRYAPEQSTFIVECTEETFARTGLGETDEDATIAYCERLFADELAGHKLLKNRSHWRQFPTVRCDRWHAGNVALVGDAVHTAHFSIGSGTKLAMEGAIALATALKSQPTIPAALAAYEARAPARRRGAAARRAGQPRLVRGDRALLRQARSRCSSPSAC